MHPLLHTVPLALAVIAAAMVLPAAARAMPHSFREREWRDLATQAGIVAALAVAIVVPAAHIAVWAAETAVLRGVLAAVEAF